MRIEKNRSVIRYIVKKIDNSGEEIRIEDINQLTLHGQLNEDSNDVILDTERKNL